MDVETKLRELLLPVLGLSSIDQIQPDRALVNDLGAESIDFVEILYAIETNFGVKISIQEISMVEYGAKDVQEGVLTEGLAEKLNKDFDTERFKAGQTAREIFETFTVRELATVVSRKMQEQKSS